MDKFNGIHIFNFHSVIIRGCLKGDPMFFFSLLEIAQNEDPHNPSSLSRLQFLMVDWH